MENTQLTFFGRMLSEHTAPTTEKTSEKSSKKLNQSQPEEKFMCLDRVNLGLLPEAFWEIGTPSLGEHSMHNIGESPREEKESTLSQILEEHPPKKYYLISAVN